MVQKDGPRVVRPGRPPGLAERALERDAVKIDIGLGDVLVVVDDRFRRPARALMKEQPRPAIFPDHPKSAGPGIERRGPLREIVIPGRHIDRAAIRDRVVDRGLESSRVVGAGGRVIRIVVGHCTVAGIGHVEHRKRGNRKFAGPENQRSQRRRQAVVGDQPVLELPVRAPDVLDRIDEAADRVRNLREVVVHFIRRQRHRRAALLKPGVRIPRDIPGRIGHLRSTLSVEIVIDNLQNRQPKNKPAGGGGPAGLVKRRPLGTMDRRQDRA